MLLAKESARVFGRERLHMGMPRKAEFVRTSLDSSKDGTRIPNLQKEQADRTDMEVHGLLEKAAA